MDHALSRTATLPAKVVHAPICTKLPSGLSPSQLLATVILHRPDGHRYDRSTVSRAVSTFL